MPTHPCAKVNKRLVEAGNLLEGQALNRAVGQMINEYQRFGLWLDDLGYDSILIHCDDQL